MADKEVIINGVDVKECIFYIDHNPPEGSGTWGGAIHKGACKVNSTDCKDTEGCFIKNLYNKLQAKEQECEIFKKQKSNLINTCCHFKNETKKYKKAVHKYKVVLQDKIERLHLSRREFLKEINSISKRIACNNEDFKNSLNNFNNAIQVINNEDRYKQALDEIEEIVSADYYDDSWGTLAIKIDSIKEIINKAKDGE